MKRRALLRTLGGTLAAGIAGCTGSPRTRQATTIPTSARPAERPETDQPCKNGGELVGEIVVEYGTLAGFDLKATKATVAQGETVGFRLENVTNEEQLSGNKSKYTIHRETTAGWRDIFYRAPDSEQTLAYHDDAVSQPPGEGFRWGLEFSTSGLEHDIENGLGSRAVCEPLPSGTYRFVYWGITTDEEIEGSENEYALGVQFEMGEH